MKLSKISVTILVLMSLTWVAPWAASDAGTGNADDNKATGRVVAYYFHGNARCSTCRKIEAYSEEAISSAFEGELADGRLEWRAVNVDEKENRHFVGDFQLVTKSVVLVEYSDGEVVRWENLSDVWQLVRNKERFVEYIQTQTREFLGEG